MAGEFSDNRTQARHSESEFMRLLRFPAEEQGFDDGIKHPSILLSFSMKVIKTVRE
jgi:hypothetical protein